MYQPALLPEQIKSLYQLKLKVNRLMTDFARDAIDLCLARYGDTGVERDLDQNELGAHISARFDR